MSQATPSTELERILAGDARAVARAISKVEDNVGNAAGLMKSVFPHTGRGLIIGITGSPGAGKSSLVDKLAGLYRERGERVGIVCVDPSSPFSGGAILGDRIRMQTLGLDPNVFIRSMATRGNLGGLSRATIDAVAILDAAGYEKIIVETVGVGQDEVEIVKAADVSVVVLVPGMGDDVQALKAGIMEISDVFVINKADRAGVDETRRDLQQMLELSGPFDAHDGAEAWRPPIIATAATTGEGVAELWSAIAGHREHAAASGRLQRRRSRRMREELGEIVTRRLEQLARSFCGDQRWNELVEGVLARRIDPWSAADEMIDPITSSLD